MKVLITDGSNKITWYYGKTGLTFPVIDIRDCHYIVPEQEGEEGTVGVHFPDGELLYTFAEYSEVHQELLRRREEVKELTFSNESIAQELEAIKADEKRAIANADRLQVDKVRLINKLRESRKAEEKHIRQVVELRREVRRLQDEVDEAREVNNVALPQEVAEAIDYLGHRNSRRHIIELMLTGDVRGRRLDYDDSRNKAVIAIRDYEFDDILLALVNGYTVEKPAETPKQKAIQYCIKHGLVSSGHSEHDVVSAIMSILGTEQSG